MWVGRSLSIKEIRGSWGKQTVKRSGLSLRLFGPVVEGRVRGGGSNSDQNETRRRRWNEQQTNDIILVTKGRKGFHVLYEVTTWTPFKNTL